MPHWPLMLDKKSKKTNDPNSRYIEKGSFWDPKWPNLGLNDGHASSSIEDDYTTYWDFCDVTKKN